MKVLVLNCGSSSLKADILDENGVRLGSLRAERLGSDDARYRLDGAVTELPGADHGAVLAHAMAGLVGDHQLDAVGHRVVHGGEAFSAPTRLDAQVEAAIEELIPLAPLHNPANLAGIRAAREFLPAIPHVAVFDTAFHATLPHRAQAYAIDHDVASAHGVRRYGFHGTSHAFVSRAAAEFLDEDPRELRVITCHLGNGASACAVEYGRSVETTMGMTPLEGLVMGTRCGDLDPGVVIALARELGLDEVDRMLNRSSGLAGLSGVGNDLRDIEERASKGDERCRMALHVLTHRLRKHIGALAAVMGGVDVLVFTAGIGENSALVRSRACQRMEFLGARLDRDANRDAKVDRATPVIEISEPRSRVKILVVATDEELEIARQACTVGLGQDQIAGGLPSIPIGISARHIHLTQESVEALFGPGHQLTPRNPLSQPGQFACEERLTVVGPKRRIEGVRILGPVRPANQIEVSRTDEFFLGVDAPVRNSGDVKNTPGVTLIGPAGQVTLSEGLICARRHIHMTPEDAAVFGVEDKDVVDVAIHSEGRDLVFGDVLVRVKASYALEMHIDTDEANAAEIKRGASGKMIDATGRVGRLVRRKAWR
ncbi:MAG: acetate/propionate family kinase [Proteobacteria bacterium]|nr:acetate/propionate family kinase [Pseudomonadota bacterium]MCP4916707.1 acetate/propionate family kinase [Pseudomonadota bacterium]